MTNILIEAGAIRSLPGLTKKEHPDETPVIVSDRTILKHYRPLVDELFPEALILEVPAGEEQKNLGTVEALARQMLEAGITRSGVLIGVGGGVITDLAGFLASVYMRGIAYIAVPTSLLGMVDAAVGGKTGVNLISKNSIGTFYPAKRIVIDTDFLNKLGDRELRSGLGEAIKYAAIIDSSLEADLLKSPLDRLSVIKKSVAAKTRISQQDFEESGMRKLLNFGHTFGHAVEQLSNYYLQHGEAISIGMVLANKLAQKLGKQGKETGDRIEALIRHHGLPTRIPADMRFEDLAELVRKDKKVHGKTIDFIIVPEMGRAEILTIETEKLIDLLQ